MDQLVEFRCLVCSKRFKGPQERAERQVCRTCDQRPAEMPVVAAVSPVQVEEPKPQREPEDEFVPQYQFVRKMASLVIAVAEWCVWMTVLPVILFFGSLADKKFLSPWITISILFSWVSSVMVWWFGCKLIQVVIDMANNLQRIADRK